MDDVGEIRVMIEKIRSKREAGSDDVDPEDAKELMGAVFALSTKWYLLGRQEEADQLERWVKRMMEKNKQGEQDV
jgi:hypothetical protein